MATLSPTFYKEIISNQQAIQRQNLLNMLNKHELCDVTFQIGSEMIEFKANRAFLAAISPAFKAMLYGNMKEGKPNAIVEIDDVDPKAFECVLKFAYMNDPGLNANNIVMVKALSERYQIKLLSKMCDKLFPKCVAYNNFFNLLNESVHYKVDVYVGQMMKKLTQFEPKRLIQSKGFSKMNLKSMEFFLKTMDRAALSEEELWNSVVAWANHRADILKAICPLIRFDLMDGAFFVKNVQPLNLFTAQESLDILSRIVCKERKSKKTEKSVWRQLPYVESYVPPHLRTISRNYDTTIKY